MNTGENVQKQQRLEEILIRVRNALPYQIDQIAQELSNLPEIDSAIIRFMSQEQYVEECYQLLKRFNTTDTIILLESLLDSANELVRRYAMLTLSDRANPPKSPRLRQELFQWLGQIPHPPTNESECIDILKALKRLLRTGAVEGDVAARLQAILFFIPRGRYQEAYWPRAWVEASRLLYELGFIDKLREVACSQKTHYLSAVGALVLATSGFMEGSVERWLKNSRDYYLLTWNERQELEQILLQLEDAEIQLAQLESLRSRYP